MSKGRDDDHLLLEDGNKLDARLVFHIGAEDHVIPLRLQTADHFSGICLVKIKTDLFVSAFGEKFPNSMRNILRCKWENIGDVHMTGAAGEFFHLFFSQLYVCEYPVRVFEKKSSVFCQFDGASFPLEQDDPQLFLEIGNGTAQRRLRDIQTCRGKPEMFIFCNGLKI